jgi:hypothetical protein
MERKRRKRGTRNTHDSHNFFFGEEIKKKKKIKRKRASDVFSRQWTKKTIPRQKERDERGGGRPVTLHTRDKQFHHHGTQTNLETVHLQNDRVRAFIKPS